MLGFFIFNFIVHDIPETERSIKTTVRVVENPWTLLSARSALIDWRPLDVTRRWTVDDLGREVGLSRSALADRFIRLVGVPPANWRMQVATEKLRNTSASLAQIAELGGYDSEAAFSPPSKRRLA